MVVAWCKEYLQLRSLLEDRWAMLVAVAATLASLTVVVMLTFGRPDSEDYWADWELINENSTVRGSGTVCEDTVYGSFSIQRYNAFASFSFILYGVWCFVFFVSDYRASKKYEYRFGNRPASLIMRHYIWSLVFSFAFIFQGVTTWIRFSSNSVLGQDLQQVGEWSTTVAICGCALVRMLDPPSKEPSTIRIYRSKVISIVASLLVLAFGVIMLIQLQVYARQGLPDTVYYALGGLLVVTSTIHWRLHALSIDSESWLFFFLAPALFGLGYIAAYLDKRGVFCIPDSFFQFNALWYVFLSSSFFTVYLYFRTDYWKDGEGADIDDLINQVGLEGGRRLRNGRNAGKVIGGGNRSRAGSSTAGSRRGGGGSFTSASGTSHVFTPQLWLSSGALYAGEVVCGLMVLGFVGWVIYFAYTNA